MTMHRKRIRKREGGAPVISSRRVSTKTSARVKKTTGRHSMISRACWVKVSGTVSTVFIAVLL
jgi:hypothetical protein